MCKLSVYVFHLNLMIVYKILMINILLKMAIHGTLVRDKSVNNNYSSNDYLHS